MCSSTQDAPGLHEGGGAASHLVRLCKITFLFWKAGRAVTGAGSSARAPSQVNSPPGLIISSCHTLKPQSQKPPLRSSPSMLPKRHPLRPQRCLHTCLSPARGKGPQTSFTSARLQKAMRITTLLLVLFISDIVIQIKKKCVSGYHPKSTRNDTW